MAAEYPASECSGLPAAFSSDRNFACSGFLLLEITFCTEPDVYLRLCS